MNRSDWDSNVDEEDWERELPEPDDEDSGIDVMTCHRCGSDFDSELPYCPLCGAETRDSNHSLKRISMVFIVILLVAMMLLGSLWWGL